MGKEEKKTNQQEIQTPLSLKYFVCTAHISFHLIVKNNMGNGLFTLSSVLPECLQSVQSYHPDLG